MDFLTSDDKMPNLCYDDPVPKKVLMKTKWIAVGLAAALIACGILLWQRNRKLQEETLARYTQALSGMVFTEWMAGTRDGDHYVLIAKNKKLDGSNWDAAKISLRMEIWEYEGELRLKGVREGYSEFLLQQE